MLCILSPETPTEATESLLSPVNPYLVSLPYQNVLPSCNCVFFRDKYYEGFSYINTSEGSTGHTAVILKVEFDSYVIIESNYISCQISIRRIYKNNPKILEVVF